jgi:hypothetical protein
MTREKQSDDVRKRKTNGRRVLRIDGKMIKKHVAL